MEKGSPILKLIICAERCVLSCFTKILEDLNKSINEVLDNLQSPLTEPSVHKFIVSY